MRTIMAVVAGLTLAAGALEAQAVASPSSKVAPRAPARGIRTEPPPPPDPNQPAPPPQGERPSAIQPVNVGGPVPYYYYQYGYSVGTGGAYFESEGTYAQMAPPPSQIDVRGPQPGPAMTFIPGFWSWTGSSYNWNEGRWVPTPAGYTEWIPGKWMQNQLGYYYLRGFWR